MMAFSLLPKFNNLDNLDWVVQKSYLIPYFFNNSRSVKLSTVR